MIGMTGISGLQPPDRPHRAQQAGAGRRLRAGLGEQVDDVTGDVTSDLTSSLKAGPAGRPWGLSTAQLAPLLTALLAALLLALLLPRPALAQGAAGTAGGGVQPVPTLTARVMDQTATLTEAQRAALESKLADFEQTDGTQIAILLVPSTQPEDIAAYAQRVADAWKLGRRDVGDGLLIVVARNDRTVRIEVAKALEGAVPDLAARRVIDRALVPAFQAGDTAGGLNAALDELFRLIRAEKLAPATRANQASQRGDGLDWQQLGLFLFVALPVLGSVLTTLLGRKLGAVVSGLAVGGLGWLFTSSLLLALAAAVIGVLLVGALGVGGRRGGWGGPVIGGPSGGWNGRSNGGWSGGGGRGGGWGGFSSGGGGDFGGGGASGRW